MKRIIKFLLLIIIPNIFAIGMYYLGIALGASYFSVFPAVFILIGIFFITNSILYREVNIND